MNKLQFIENLEKLFPEAFASIGEIDKGLIHCEIASFREWVELQMSSEMKWNCEKAFKFVADCLVVADSDLENAIEISFIEDLALGEHKLVYKDIIKERAPKVIREKLVQVHEYWK